MPVEHVDGADDPRLALYRGVSDPALLREHGCFIAEGRLVVRRIVEHHPALVQSVVLNRAAAAQLASALELRLHRVPIYVVSDAAIAQVAGHHVHRGALAIARRPAPTGIDAWLAAVLPEPRALQPAPVLAAAEGLASPDNVGALFRNAAAFGAAGVLLDPSCSDPLYRKAIRTSVGTVLDVPFARADAWPDALVRARAEGVRLVALTVGARTLDDPSAAIDVAQAAAELAAVPVLLLVGNEGIGLSEEAERACDVRARIPMAPGVDSLNAATAAALALYVFTAVRRRDAGATPPDVPG